MMPLLEITGLSKRFGGVLALDDIDLSIEPGEIHSLVGENGAGKSTLLKAISGIVRPDDGDVHFEGQRITSTTPAHLFGLGISAAFQETSLFDNLTVTENLFLGRLHTHHSATIDWTAASESARQALADFGALEIAPDTRVAQLPAEMRQILEILKAVRPGVRVVSLDEPTSSLSKMHVRSLFNLLHRLKESGVAVIYVSHHLDEVLAISDRVTVFRDGHKVGTLARHEASEQKLHEMMIGRSVGQGLAPASPNAETATPVLRVEGLSDGVRVKDVSMDVFEGEVLGITGLVGAGRSELAWMIVGLVPTVAGHVRFHGQDITHTTPERAIQAGISYLPEDRRQFGLLLTQNLPVNTTISRLERITRGAALDFAQEKSLTRRTLDRLGVKYASLDQIVINLSGGNQQKLLLGKCLFAEPKLLILDEPTKGIDVGSKEEIYHLIRELVGQGMSLIVISSEVEEICLLSQRVLVMGGGRIIGSFTGDQINESNITACYLQTAKPV